MTIASNSLTQGRLNNTDLPQRGNVDVTMDTIGNCWCGVAPISKEL